jgi:hypothetical protein
MRRPRKKIYQTGWRLPVEIIEALRKEAARQGIRPGQLYEQILRRRLSGLDRDHDDGGISVTDGADTVDESGAVGYELSLLANDRPDVSKQGRAF